MSIDVLSTEVRAPAELPPTELAPGAHEWLIDHSLDWEDLDRLTEISAKFRYDRVMERVGKMTHQEVFVANDQGREYALLPHFYDVMGSLEGQCTDLSMQFIANGEVQSWLHDMNDKIENEGGSPLELWRVNGTSRTHFNHAPANPYEVGPHYWVALSEQGNYDFENRVDIDVTFQIIGTPDELEYGYRGHISNPSSIGESLTGITEIGSLELRANGNYRAQYDRDNAPLVIGRSASGEYIYSGLFLRNENTGNIQFAIERLHPNGEHTEIFFWNPENQMLDGDTDAFVTTRDRKELQAILQASENFRFRDPDPGNNHLSDFPYPIDPVSLQDRMYHTIKL